jgi:hypothetical protein
MKAIRIRRAQFALAAALTCFAASAFADQSHFSYTLGVGATRIIAVPEVNTPIQLSCTQNQAGNVGVGEATIIRANADGYLHWVGIDFYEGTISRGYSSTSGAHIIYCDSSSYVDIAVLSATQIQVRNNGTSTQTGVVMLVY